MKHQFVNLHMFYVVDWLIPGQLDLPELVEPRGQSPLTDLVGDPGLIFFLDFVFDLNYKVHPGHGLVFCHTFGYLFVFLRSHVALR